MLNLISMVVVHAMIIGFALYIAIYIPQYRYFCLLMGGVLFVPAYVFQIIVIFQRRWIRILAFLTSLVVNLAMCLMQIYAVVELINNNKSMLAFCITNGVLLLFSLYVVISFYVFRNEDVAFVYDEDLENNECEIETFS